MPRSTGFFEVESFLNDVDARRPLRREHHLSREQYARTDVVFFVTVCARHQGEPFCADALARMVVDSLRHRQRQNLWRLYAYCLMPDHLHAVVQLCGGATNEPADEDLLTVLGRFRSYTTHQSWRHGIRGQLWQHDQYDRLLRNDCEFATRCQYVLDNPVRKGLVEDWTVWPYSGACYDW